MRSVSQIIVAILLVGAAVVAGSLLSYIVTDMISTYKPSEVMIARVGSINVELREVSSGYYYFTVSTKLANLGTEPLTLRGGYITILVKGTTGKAIIRMCAIYRDVTISPGEIRDLTGICQFDKATLKDLFGTSTPPADKVKHSIVFLYLHTRLFASGPSLEKFQNVYIT